MDALASYTLLVHFLYFSNPVSLLSPDGQEVGSRELQACQRHLEKAGKTIVWKPFPNILSSRRWLGVVSME